MPAISVIITGDFTEEGLVSFFDMVARQTLSSPVEIILGVTDEDTAIDRLKKQYPYLTTVPVREKSSLSQEITQLIQHANAPLRLLTNIETDFLPHCFTHITTACTSLPETTTFYFNYFIGGSPSGIADHPAATQSALPDYSPWQFLRIPFVPALFCWRQNDMLESHIPENAEFDEILAFIFLFSSLSGGAVQLKEVLATKKDITGSMAIASDRYKNLFISLIPYIPLEPFFPLLVQYRDNPGALLACFIQLAHFCAQPQVNQLDLALQCYLQAEEIGGRSRQLSENIAAVKNAMQQPLQGEPGALKLHTISHPVLKSSPITKGIIFTADNTPHEISMAGFLPLQSTEPIPAHTTSPLVSVIIPTHNRPEMLEQAISSVLLQSYPHIEIIVVNDAGRSVESVIAQYNLRGTITYIESDKSSGPSRARNLGIAISQGKYLLYLDDDDRLYADHVQRLVHCIETTSYRAVYTDSYQAIQVEKEGRWETIGHRLLHSFDFDYNRIFIDNFIPILCIMHERALFEETGAFDETLLTHEDWELWIRLSLFVRFYHLPIITSEFTYRAKSNSQLQTREIPDFLETKKLIYKKYAREIADRPQIQALQQRSLQLHSDMVARRTTEKKRPVEQARSEQNKDRSIEPVNTQNFMTRIISYIEQNAFTEADSFYSRYRPGLPQSPELVQFDTVYAQIKAKSNT